MGCRRTCGLNRGRSIAEVPEVRNDRTATRAPVAVEGDHVARWDAGNTQLVGKSREGIGGSVCLDRQPYSRYEYRDCKYDRKISQRKPRIHSSSVTVAGIS